MPSSKLTKQIIITTKMVCSRACKPSASWPLTMCIIALVTTTSTAAVGTTHETSTTTCHKRSSLSEQQHRFNARRLAHCRPLTDQQQQHNNGGDSHHTKSPSLQQQLPHRRSTCVSIRAAEQCVALLLDFRGGSSNEPGQEAAQGGEGDEPGAGEARLSPDFLPPPGGKQNDNKAAEKIEKIAADLRAKRDDIAADVRARGEAIATDLKAKQEAIAADLKATQEKITDEVLRDRSPEAFGELGGHKSYDSATAGMDVANRRSFFLGVRRIVLLAQVVELIIACVWQAAFPYGGVAGFVATGNDKSATATTPAPGGDMYGRGRVGIALAGALGQGALYTILMVFFGCDRVVLRTVRWTGWEHGVAAAWALARAMGVAGGGGKLSHVILAAWLAGMAFLCGYFGRQL